MCGYTNFKGSKSSGSSVYYLSYTAGIVIPHNLSFFQMLYINFLYISKVDLQVQKMQTKGSDAHAWMEKFKI